MTIESRDPLPELLTQAQAGDTTAREQLFAECRSYVALLARVQIESWLRTRVDSSDLVQQTLLDVHRDFHAFRGKTETEWLAWLRQILKHNAQDFVRHYRGTEKRQQRKEVRLRSAGDDPSAGRAELADGGESPSAVVMRREREVEVAAAIERLPPDYQEVILLRNLQRLPFDEVARRMGRSRPAVQMLWMRALQKLREMLTQ